MIAPSASLPALTESGLTNIVRLSSRDDAQGGFAAQRMQKDYAGDKIAIVGDGSDAATELLANFSTAYSGQPGLPLTFKPDAKNFEPITTAVQVENIKALYCACTASDAGELAAELGNSVKLFGPDALLVPQFWEKSGPAGEGTLVSFAADPQTAGEARSVLRRIGTAEGATLPSYVGVQLFAEAIKTVGSQNGKAIATLLKSGKVFETAIGNLAFDSKGDLRSQTFLWYVWTNGSYAAEPPPR